MQDHGNFGGADEQPVVAGAEDIDRLLDDAESLAADISTDTGATRNQDEPTGSTVEAPIEDLMATEAEVEKNLSELGAALDARRAGETEGNSDATGSAAILDQAGDDAWLTPRKPRGVNSIMDAELEAEIRQDAAAADPARPVPATATPPTVGNDAAQAAESDVAKARSSGAFRRLGRGLGYVVKLPPRCIVWLFVLLDWPFANLSPATKKLVGYVAIFTILAAAASFILPAVIHPNPYVHVKH